MNFALRTCCQRLSLATLLALALPAFAEPLTLKTEAFQEVTTKGPDGKPQTQRQAVTSAVPGTEIIYVITYRNSGSKSAEKVVVNNPVPAGLAYQPGSAQGYGARAEVSVDGGKRFGLLEQLKVQGEDGKLRAAKGSDVTHVRWTVQAPVAPGREGSVSYRAVLK